MGWLTDLVFSVPFGIIYVIFIQKFADVIFCDDTYNDRYQKSLMLLFLAGVTAIILAQTIFTYNKTLQNEIIKHGFIIGGIILILYPIIIYWDKMTNETKLIVIAVIFGGLVWYFYQYGKSDKNKNKDKNKNTNKNEKR